MDVVQQLANNISHHGSLGTHSYQLRGKTHASARKKEAHPRRAAAFRGHCLGLSKRANGSKHFVYRQDLTNGLEAVKRQAEVYPCIH